jgi:hypothetical protein
LSWKCFPAALYAASLSLSIWPYKQHRVYNLSHTAVLLVIWFFIFLQQHPQTTVHSTRLFSFVYRCSKQNVLVVHDVSSCIYTCTLQFILFVVCLKMLTTSLWYT